jgi:hypothetical protein
MLPRHQRREEDQQRGREVVYALQQRDVQQRPQRLERFVAGVFGVVEAAAFRHRDGGYVGRLTLREEKKKNGINGLWSEHRGGGSSVARASRFCGHWNPGGETEKSR